MPRLGPGEDGQHSRDKEQSDTCKSFFGNTFHALHWGFPEQSEVSGPESITWIPLLRAVCLQP